MTVTGLIYFVQAVDGGPVKIGWVERPDGLSKRLVTLQCGNPRKLRVCGTRPGRMSDEKLLHLRFAEQRIRGEWFEVTPSLARLTGARQEADLVR